MFRRSNLTVILCLRTKDDGSCRSKRKNHSETSSLLQIDVHWSLFDMSIILDAFFFRQKIDILIHYLCYVIVEFKNYDDLLRFSIYFIRFFEIFNVHDQYLIYLKIFQYIFNVLKNWHENVNSIQLLNYKRDVFTSLIMRIFIRLRWLTLKTLEYLFVKYDFDTGEFFTSNRVSKTVKLSTKFKNQLTEEALNH